MIRALVLLLVLATPCLAQDLGFAEAAARYGVAAAVLEAISWVESRQNPDVAPSKNEREDKNGEIRIFYDHGHMQINDHFWKKRLNAIDPRLWDQMVEDPKVCTQVGAWILAQNIAKYGNTWDAIAAYNTGRGIDLEDCNGDAARVERGRIYALKVYAYLAKKAQPSNNVEVVEQGKGTAPVPPASRIQALPMRQETINVASFRKHGEWRRVE
ncbi:MAG: lytic transglycosylase domain-containing protein [Sphaerochaeta sp.]|nr:lytic transglycosylase domain-containing protein [Sphaerochaeta sp.]